jgi:hypothetical protein
MVSTCNGSISASFMIGSLKLMAPNSPGLRITSTTTPVTGLRMVRMASTSLARCASSAARRWFSRARVSSSEARRNSALRFVARIGGDEVLPVQLLDALEFLGGEVDARLRQVDLALIARALFRQIEGRALGTGLERRDHLALADQAAALHPHRLDHRLDRAADLDRLARLDHAVELGRCRGRGSGQQAGADEGG